MLKIRYLFLLVVLASCSLVGRQEPASVQHYGVEKGAGSAGVHTVLEGDTLYSISERYNLAMRDIANANDLAPPFNLYVAQRLKLPPPREYTIRQGDTLYSVSRLFGVSTSELTSLNDLSPPYNLYAGQKLRIPTVENKPVRVTVSTGKVEVEPLGDIGGAQKNEEDDGDPASVDFLRREDGVPVPDKKPMSVAKRNAVAKKPVALKKISARTPKRSSSKFLKPVQGRVISTYGSKADGLHNDGINIAAARGASVQAAENGVVVYAGNELKGSGNLVLIRHDDRWMSAYAHLDSIGIKRGATVSRGDVIGKVGSTGAVDSPQLHFELRRGTKALNPSVYIGD